METAVLLLAISSVLLSLRAVIDDFRRIKEQKNWFRKESEPEENYLTSSKSHEDFNPNMWLPVEVDTID